MAPDTAAAAAPWYIATEDLYISGPLGVVRVYQAGDRVPASRVEAAWRGKVRHAITVPAPLIDEADEAGTAPSTTSGNDDGGAAAEGTAP